MEELLGVIIGRCIIRFLGINTRFYFLKIFNKHLKKDDLSGADDDFGSQVGNALLNTFVGIIVFFMIFYLVAILFFGS